MTTIAKPTTTESSHWYYPDGRPCYNVPYADPKKGNRPTTLADARKLGLLPSVTTLLKILHKEALVNWLIENACLAVLTSPRKDGEELDAFVERVLHTERVQDEESRMARDRGTEIHAALELAFLDQGMASDMESWIGPVFEDLNARGKTIGAELIVVGDGYAGKIDLVTEFNGSVWLWDFKTTKRLPTRGAWMEHILQLSGYAAAYERLDASRPIRTGNVYISTIESGKYYVIEHEPWGPTYNDGFVPLVRLWQYLNNYKLT